MGFLKSKPKTVLGIDIGAGGMKLVEFSHVKGRPQLHTYAFTERKPGEADRGLLEDPKAAAELFKKMMKEARTTTKRAVAGLPGASVFSSTFSVPSTSGKELKRAIEWQARKLIPLPIEEMVLDWKVLGAKDEKKAERASFRGLIPQEEKKSVFAKPETPGPPELGGKEAMRVLLTSVAKKLVEKYLAFAKAAELELMALETEVFALIRSLIGKDLGSVMLIDFGSVRTSLVVVERGVPVLTRSIMLGGLTVTRTIAKILGVSETDAESMKRDIHGLTALSGGKNGLPQVLQKALEPLLTEARYSLSLYARQQGGQKGVEKMVLTGGSAHLPNLASYLGEALNVNCYVGDPWARVATHEDLEPVLDDLGPRFAVAVGLAMRDFE